MAISTWFGTPALPAEQQASAASSAEASRFSRRLFLLLGAIALIYALLAGLRTVSDPDLGWQLASGRWVAQHHQVFSVDVFSFTANGQPWIYPAGAGLLFYAAFLLGGYGLISWMGAAVCAGTVALLLRRGSAFSAAIVILGMPLIAARATPRADMFTLLLFAAYLSILWQYYQTSRAPLWSLPILMVLWVNLHLGFIAGLGLIGGFVALELLQMFSAGTRREAIARLKRAWPWYIATGFATLVNPWGWNLYRAILRQNSAMELHSQRIVEWSHARWSWSGPIKALSLFNARDSLTFMLVVVIVAAVAALLQRRPGLSALLLLAMYETTRHIRMEGLTGCVAVVVGGSVLFAAVPQLRGWIPKPRWRAALALACVAFFAILATVRTYGLVSNHAYYASYSTSNFGPGLSWWFPQRAVEFIRRENLPGQIYNTYDFGGYLDWTLVPKYPVYFDGRAIPFGTERFARESQLLGSSVDSPVWQEEADRYNINTLLIPLATGEIVHDRLKEFCYSSIWKPVYLDEISLVLVRNTPQNADVIKRLGLECAIAPLPPTAENNAQSFYQWLNSAYALGSLGRTSEALTASNKALAIYPDSPQLRWIRGDIFYGRQRRAEAEQEWLADLALEPGNSAVWFRLADLYQEQDRAADALNAYREAARLSPDAALKTRALVKLAQLYLQTGNPKQALQTLDEILQSAPPALSQATTGRSLKFDTDQGRAAAWRAMGDLQKATSFEEQAVQLDPDAADAWSHLARLYQQQGRTADQQRAEARAASLAASQPHEQPH